MLSHPTIQLTIDQFNGESFDQLFCFGMYSSINATYYYAMDYRANKVYTLNDEWKLVSFKTFTNPSYMINSGISLCMTG